MTWKHWLPILLLAGCLAALALSVVTVKQAPAQSAVLSWTAPGDDTTSGRATSYQMRYSRTVVGTDTLAWWNQAFVIPGMPVPSLAGAQDSVKVSLGAWSMTYYFVGYACDEASNCGAWSNVAVRVTPPPPDAIAPSRIRDLRAR